MAPKGTQQPGGKAKKGKDKKGGGGNKNEKSDAKYGGEKKEIKKVKFPCKICGGDHLTHQCPQMEEANHLIKQNNNNKQPVVLKNPFPQGKNMQVDLPLQICKGAPQVHLFQMDLTHSSTWSTIQRRGGGFVD
jgi:hypothetical protein